MYASGILGDGERKSVEPIAARACADPTRVHNVHCKLLHFLGQSRWDDRAVRQEAARYALEELHKQGDVVPWIIDDTGFLKQGTHSVGVQRQYTGSAGKVTNCQVGVSLAAATEHDHLPLDFELYLPQSWIDDAERRSDVRAECRRIGLPEPRIESQDVRGVGGLGLVGRARLTFQVAVAGPIVLGRDRHRGGGLSRIVAGSRARGS